MLEHHVNLLLAQYVLVKPNMNVMNFALPAGAANGLDSWEDHVCFLLAFRIITGDALMEPTDTTMIVKIYCLVP